jgi:hypothetical protein
MTARACKPGRRSEQPDCHFARWPSCSSQAAVAKLEDVKKPACLEAGFFQATTLAVQFRFPPKMPSRVRRLVNTLYKSR